MPRTKKIMPARIAGAPAKLAGRQVTTKKRTAAPGKEKAAVSKVSEPRPAMMRREKAGHYFGTVGRRKTSIARVRFLSGGNKEILVNGKPLNIYFSTPELQETVMAPLKLLNLGKFKLTVMVAGGGIHSQAEAVRHGVARALLLFNQDFRKRLKKAGFLTRDSRMRERKKFGLKRARRAPQWRKR